MQQTFKDLEIKQEYRSSKDNIIKDFYIPVLKNAVSYRRAVGFFSSSSLIQISEGICAFAKKGGKIDLVASPRLSEEDEMAIRVGYENRTKIIESALLRELKEPGNNYFKKERLNLLANLIESGVLSIKIAFIENGSNIAMYHEKLGLVEDNEGNKIAFSGSMNETETAMTKNYEAIDVFCSWKSDDASERVIQKERAFSAIWGNYEENLKVVHFPSIDKAILEKYKKESPDYDLDEKEFLKEKSRVYDMTYTNEHEGSYSAKFGESTDEWINNSEIYDSQLTENHYIKTPLWLNLHPYQKEAIQNWKNQNFIGIYDMATGTGKTLTALSSLMELYKKENGNFCTIIICPYIHLVTQWVEEILEFNCKPIIAFGSSSQKDWKEKLERAVYRRNYKETEDGFFCLITTIVTFKSKYVQKQISRIKKDILLIADEAHNLGAQNASKFLVQDKYKYRLGLSATLDRHFDKKGTQSLYDFFGYKCIEYSLEDAIKEKYLVPYYYYPVLVTLDEGEREKYLKYTKLIRNEIRYNSETGKKKLSDYGKQLCISRSRIISGCHQKLPALLKKLSAYKDKNMILIYCGAVKFDEDKYSNDDSTDVKQIDEVIERIYEEYKMKICRFTAETSIEQREIIKEKFSKGEELQAIAAIKCLDEGVNIPSIRTAFILASSTNPKEYIQRRGRVLRIADGKEYAEIYDFITLPFDLETTMSKSEFEIQPFRALAKNELARIKEFSSLAIDGFKSNNLIENITLYFNLQDTREDLDLEENIYE